MKLSIIETINCWSYQKSKSIVKTVKYDDCQLLTTNYDNYQLLKLPTMATTNG